MNETAASTEGSGAATMRGPFQVCSRSQPKLESSLQIGATPEGLRTFLKAKRRLLAAARLEPRRCTTNRSVCDLLRLTDLHCKSVGRSDGNNGLNF